MACEFCYAIHQMQMNRLSLWQYVLGTFTILKIAKA